MLYQYAFNSGTVIPSPQIVTSHNSVASTATTVECADYDMMQSTQPTLFRPQNTACALPECQIEQPICNKDIRDRYIDFIFNTPYNSSKYIERAVVLACSNNQVEILKSICAHKPFDVINVYDETKGAILTDALEMGFEEIATLICETVY